MEAEFTDYSASLNSYREEDPNFAHHMQYIDTKMKEMKKD